MVGAVGWVETAFGDDMEAVPGQDLAVGVVVAGADVEANVWQLQTLNQQPPLRLLEAFIDLRKWRGRETKTKHR